MFAEEYSFEPQPFGFEPKCVTSVESGGYSAAQGFPLVRGRGLHKFKNPWLDQNASSPWARPFLDAASRAAILDDVSKFEK
jgi:hypothetical protein